MTNATDQGSTLQIVKVCLDNSMSFYNLPQLFLAN